MDPPTEHTWQDSSLGPTVPAVPNGPHTVVVAQVQDRDWHVAQPGDTVWQEVR